MGGHFMAAIAHATLDPCSQVQELFYSIGDLVGSISESTDAAFKKVQIQKKDANGNIKLYSKKETVIDPQTGQKNVLVKTVDLLDYTHDVKTGDLYIDDPVYVVSLKCVLVALGLPFQAVAKAGWHAIKTSLQIGSIAFESISQIGKRMSEGFVCEAISEAFQFFVRGAKVLATGLFNIIKIPLFALGAEIAALYGIFKPYHGRKFEARIEKAWESGASYKEDVRNIPPPGNGESHLTAFFSGVRDTPAFYLAHCFQVRGNTHDPRVVLVP